MTAIGRKLILVTVLAAGPAFATAGLAEQAHPDEERRVASYEEFRRLFDAGHFAEALPFAREVVELTEAADPLHDELPTAWNNLGAAQFRAGDPVAAEASFGRALELLENTESISSRRLISPLAGLGAVYAATGQPARAADVLHRAIGISRRANGLFNPEQLELLEALIESYESLGNLEGVDQERRYALRVLEQEYGYDDPRTLPALVKLAEWYERRERFALARLQWARAVQIGLREGGGRNAATINGLLGIARSHRLQFVRDPESLAEMQLSTDPLTGRPDPSVPGRHRLPASVKLDPDGEAAALKALEILDGTGEPPRGLLVSTLLELGDWYVTAHEPRTAMPYYQRAWPLLREGAAGGEPNPLLEPRPLHYRPPAAAVRNLSRSDALTVAEPLEFRLTVTVEGQTTDVVAVTEADDGRLAQVRRALDRAWFSPRFEDGQPVRTEGFRFVEYWVEIAEQPETPPEPADDDLPLESRPDAEAATPP